MSGLVRDSAPAFSRFLYRDQTTVRSRHRSHSVVTDVNIGSIKKGSQVFLLRAPGGKT